MNQHEIENWRKVKNALEASGKTKSQIYVRACEVLNKYGVNSENKYERNI